MINRKTDPEEVKKLYASIDSQNLTDEEQYKYLTQHDADIVKYKERVFNIVKQKGLGSYMNDSKWLQLQKEIIKLDFSPPYLEKLVTDNEFRYANVDTNNVSFFGDWAPFYKGGMPLFFDIEYLMIIPRRKEYVGKQVNDKTLDISEKLKEILTKINIPFETNCNNFIVYGYK
ncbi:hypothetical protein MHTCC0001_06390 [Flavobacteriaceae bacterium MHTCC 0001]